VRYGKQVDLKIYGSSTPIDRFILEALGDPLMHLIRNAFDHGIEDPQMRQQAGKPLQGTIEIRAVHRGNQTLISVSDDGGGINLDKIRDRARKMGLSPTQLDAASGTELLDLIFEPGFSTADRVTDLSGRGVGMDVVRTNLRDIRGDVRVETVLGQGTTFTLSFPFTLSILRVLLVESGGMLLALPSDGIEEMLLVKPESIYATAAQEVLDWEGTMVPLVRLEQGLTFHCPHSSFVSDSTPTIDAPTAFVISRGADLAALQVDRFWGEQEVAIRPVEAAIALPPGFAGCTILGDGRVVPLADTAKLLDWMTNRSLPVGSSPLGNSFDLASLGASDDGSTATTQYRQAAILIVDDSINVRRFLALTLEKAGYRVEQARDGQDAVEKLVGGLAVQAVICDIEMPRLDGFGVLARIKSDPAFRELPIAMLTSRSGAKHRQLANSLGAAAYFSKPYNEQELLSTLKTLIRQPSLSPIS
jgi:chemosensory pili system protein ChpA (sensor histidine kinase/response regulator)